MRVLGASAESARTGLVRYMPGHVTVTLTGLYCRLPPPVPQLPVEPVVETQATVVVTV